jgi:hypothetical protein
MRKLEMKTLRTFALVALAAAVAAITPAVHAAAVDVTAVVTDINAQMAPITSLATAVLTVFVGIKAFHWVRRALS